MTRKHIMIVAALLFVLTRACGDVWFIVPCESGRTIYEDGVRYCE